MKVLLFWNYYEKYIDDIYARNKNLREASCNEQLNKILADQFGWPPALVKKLENQGHEVEILLVNAEPLQRSWAKENSIIFDESNWQYQIPLEQVKKFKPDILWIGPLFSYFGEYINKLKPHCNKIFAWTACPIPKSLDLSHIDCFLTSHANFKDYFIANGKSCEILLPAFEENILETITKEDCDIECNFVGSLTWSHIERMNMISRLSKKVDIEIWADQPKLLNRQILKPGFIRAYLDLFRVKRKIHPGVWGLDMYNILARSNISVNIHGDGASGLAGNMRMFEATGVGSLLLTENAPNIRDLYEPGKEVVTYENVDDLIHKIEYYISRPEERKAIAEAGQARTLKDHTTTQRSKELIEIFSKYLQK